MTGSIADGEVLLHATNAATLKADYMPRGEHDPWNGSSFAWIRTLPSRQRGKIGEQLVSGWCAAKGIDVTSSGDSEADRVIAGRRMEVKFSTLWASGVYKFQQIRDQNYDYLICLGVSPFDAHCWLVSKPNLRAHVIGHTPQHRGQPGTDTYWLSFPAAQPPDWLAENGGPLGRALTLLLAISRQGGASLSPGDTR